MPDVVRSLGLNPTTAQLAALGQQLITAAAALPLAGQGSGTRRAAAAAPGGSTAEDASTPAGSRPASSSSADEAPLLVLELCEPLIAAWVSHPGNRSALRRDGMHTLLRALHALDPQRRGWLDAAQLAALLTSCGDDALSAREAAALLAAAADERGRVCCQELALMFAADGRVQQQEESWRA